MTTYTKPAVRSSWGQTATPSDLQDPGNTYSSAGWQIGVKPPRQFFNWVLNYTSNAIRYFSQNGIVDWDTAEVYLSNAIVRGSDGRMYRMIAGSSQGENPTVTPTSWSTIATVTAAASDNSSNVATTSWVRGYALPIGSTFSAIGGQVLNGQVPVGAVTQWQGSLSISGGQVTSAVARANTVLNTSGQYATFNWSGQSGQPSWLWGSNDGLNYYVWNPANFSVSNANTVAGLGVTSAAAGNTVMARDANGYAYATYLNQVSANGENPAISQFMVTNGSDNFLRKSSVAAAKAAIGALSVSDFPSLGAVSGYQRLPTGIVLQWGYAQTFAGSGPQDVGVTFPVSFPNSCGAVMVATNRSVSGMGQAIDGSNFSSFYTRNGCVITVDNSGGGISSGYWFAIGY